MSQTTYEYLLFLQNFQVSNIYLNAAEISFYKLIWAKQQ